MRFEEKWMFLVLVILFGDIVEITAVTSSTSPSKSSSTTNPSSSNYSTQSSSTGSPSSTSAASTTTWSTTPFTDITTVMETITVNLTTSLPTPGSTPSGSTPIGSTSTVITTTAGPTTAVTNTKRPSTSSSTGSRSTPSESIPTSDSITVLANTTVNLTSSLSTTGSSIPLTSAPTNATPIENTSAVLSSTIVNTIGNNTTTASVVITTIETTTTNVTTIESSSTSTTKLPSSTSATTTTTPADVPTTKDVATTTIASPTTTFIETTTTYVATTIAAPTTTSIETTTTNDPTTTDVATTTIAAPTTTTNVTTIESSSTSTTKLPSSTSATTTTTPADVPTTKDVATTTIASPTTTFIETTTTDVATTIAAPTTTSIETTTTNDPTTTDVATTTIAAPTTTYVVTTTTNDPTTTDVDTTTITAPTTTYVEPTTTNSPTTTDVVTTTITAPTTTSIETTTTNDPTTTDVGTTIITAPTTTYVEPTTTNSPTTTDNATTTIAAPTTTYIETTTTDDPTTTVTVTSSSSANTPSSTTQTIYTSQVVLTTPNYECSNEAIKPPEYGLSISAGTSVGSVVIYLCINGYILHGTNYSECILNGSDAIWSTPVPTCNPRDCGPWNASTNNYVAHINTTYGSTAVSICYPGYAINGGNKTSTAAKCSANGTWTILTPPPCTIIVCDHFDLNKTDAMNITYTSGTNANSTATFSCPDGYSVNGYKSITCDRSGRWTGVPPSCKQVDVDIPYCPADKDSHGLRWNATAPGEIATSECGEGYSGKISRRCNNGRWLLPVYDCISKAIAEVDKKIDAIIVQENVTNADVLDALHALSSATSKTDTTTVYSGEITKVTSILDTIVDITEKVNVTKAQAKSFADIASNLLSTKNTESWNSISENQGGEDNKGDTGAPKILNVVSKYSDAMIKSLNSKEKHITVTTDNLVLQASKIDQTQNVTFPADNQNLNVSCAFTLSKEAVEGIQSYSAIVYKNISGIMSSNFSSESTESRTLTINSAVISVKMANVGENFSIDISLGHLGEVPGTEPKCTFWNESLNAWSGNGCKSVRDSNNKTVCQCNHLTNFAILMSPWTEANVVNKAIDIISIIGCSVSMVGLLVTVITHIVLWRYLKSDRVVLLMNLSVALILSYAIFVGGVDKTDNKDACTIVAVLLHYIYLVVFCLMLAEGIEIAVQVVYVFSTKSRLKWMIPCAWLLPAVIVAISMGVTQLKGYGNKQTCWLSVDQGLIWAFVAPALTVILVNFVLLGLAIKAMFGTASLAQKSRVERVRTGVRCLCILVPLMGCTWVIGVFYVNESVAWIQYVFAVCNSLQGLVIFLFHCVLNKQIRIAIQKRRRLYYKSSMETKQTSRTFSMPRISLSNNSLQSMDNSYGTSTGYNRAYADSERYEFIQNPIHRRSYREYEYIDPTRI